MSMYTEYFGLTENPFSIAPDPRYLYLSEQHREALAHLLYGVASDGGFVLLTGEVGTGKTTICRCLLEQLPDNCDVAFIFNPKLSVEELLSTICDEFKINYPPQNHSVKIFVDLINDYLLKAHANNRKAVLIIDEAQNLNSDVLEQIRLLTNLETNQRKLLQVILLGQPELRQKLSQPKLRQLAQRIIARFHLGPLSNGEVTAYVYHRLNVAGSRRPLFPNSTLAQLHRLSGGIPRLINVLCDRALLGCYVQGKENVDKATLARAAKEVFGEPQNYEDRYKKAILWSLVAMFILAIAAFLTAAYQHYLPNRTATKEAKTAVGERILNASPETPLRQQIPSIKRQLPPLPEADSKLTPQLQSAVEKQSASPPAEAVETRLPAEGEQLQTNENLQLNPPHETESTPVEPPKPIEIEPTKPSPQTPALTIKLSKLIWPADEPIANSRNSATEALFRLWGISFKAQQNMSTCQQAEAQGLACLSGKGSLDDLRKYNRPAILRLYSEQGTEFYATLTNLEGQSASFILGGHELVVPVDEIALRWLGDYNLLWRVPPHYQGVIQLGDRGPVVEWLQQQLSKVQDRPAGSEEKAVFDESMVKEVKKFQLARGLQPDGIVGPQTLILLNTAVKSESPLLIR